ncbi:MAG: Hsp20/alpha crystallin family protein [Lentisphaeria bacterium]|nr:Hsp20/alpha crystallin family protein [Lentisphaeria bacterium]
MYYAPTRHHPANDSFHDLVKAFFKNYPDWNTMWTDDGNGNGMKVKIREKEVRVTLPFPGVTAKDFEVEVVGDTLTVRATRKQSSEDTARQYLCKERSTESFQESLRLPVRVNGSETKAKYQDGVLVLEIPREGADARAARTIKVD